MSEGFFTRKQTESKSRPDSKVYSCVSCGLYKSAQSPKMKPYGNFAKGILNIGEAPGEVEDEKGKPWQGKTGRLLKKTYRELGIDLFEDCLNINAINCHPTDNETPTPYQISCCRRIVMDVIKKYKPKIIVLLGTSALYSLLGHRWKKDLHGISTWRGWTIPDQEFNIWICPTFHPSYVDRAEGDEVMTVWKKDLKAIVSLVGVVVPEYKEPEIIISDDVPSFDHFVYKVDSVYIDYETTGLKPHAKGHRIICASVAVNKDLAYSFMMPSAPAKRRPFTGLLDTPEIGKMAHNIKFEELWSVVRLHQSVVNWDWDTMQTAHVLDNRPYITGLKFQTYVHFGIVDYSSEIEPYIKTDLKSGNQLNRVFELLKKPGGQEKLLKYCGLDTIYGYRLAQIQKSIIDYDLPF